MKRIVVLIVTALLLCSCGEYTDNGTINGGGREFKKVCIDNVEYLMRSCGHRGYMSPHFHPDGTLYTCNQ